MSFPNLPSDSLFKFLTVCGIFFSIFLIWHIENEMRNIEEKDDSIEQRISNIDVNTATKEQLELIRTNKETHKDVIKTRKILNNFYRKLAWFACFMTCFGIIGWSIAENKSDDYKALEKNKLMAEIEKLKAETIAINYKNNSFPYT